MEESGLVGAIIPDSFEDWRMDLTDRVNEYLEKANATPSEVVAFLTISLLVTLEGYGLSEEFFMDVCDRMQEDFKHIRNIKDKAEESNE